MKLTNEQLRDHTFERIPEWASQAPLLVGLRGSDAHGTKLSDDDPKAVDDVDVFVVTCQSKNYYLSLDGYGKSREHWDTAGEDIDILVYDVRKFFHLLYEGNPNVVSWLWNRPEDYMYGNGRYSVGRRLIFSRELFITQRLLKKLFGYAMGQKERMLRQNKYAGYMGEKRKALVDQFGYDTKFAAHTFRLLKVGVEVAYDGTAHSYRPDYERTLIKKMKSGEFDFETTMRMIDQTVDEFREAELNTTIPVSTDRKEVNRQLVDILTL